MNRIPEELAAGFFTGLPVQSLNGVSRPKEALALYVRRGVARATIRIDNDRISELIRFCDRNGGSLPIYSITPEMIDSWFASLEDRLGSVSIETYKQTIKGFFNWCVKSDQVALRESPASHLRPKRRVSARYKAANEDDIEKVIDGLLAEWVRDGDPRALRDLLAFCIARDSGKRKTEMARLATNAMNLALRNPMLTSEGIVVYIASSAAGKRGVTKVRFTEYTAAIYRLWQVIRPKSAVHRVFIALHGANPGQPLTPDGFSSIFVKRCKQFEVPVYRTHAIRHLKGTKVSDKFSPRVAATVLGISVEMAILHYYNEDDQSTLDATAV